MFLDVHDKETHKLVGRCYVCHGCGDQTPIRKRAGLPPRWIEKMELAYGSTGQRRKGSGWVINYYCWVCHSMGVTAATVAATTRKLCRIAKIRDILNPKEKNATRPVCSG